VRRALSAGVLAALAGCGTAPIANPDGLSAHALTLEYVLDRGCFAYLLGEKSERAAMRGVGLSHQGPSLALIDPPGPPMWRGPYAGLSNVVAGPRSCSVNMYGGRDPGYRAAAQSVLRRRLGEAVDQDAPSPDAPPLRGKVTGCHGGVGYAYYATPRIFSVDLRRADCAAREAL
jgi:hypothetical protein